MQERVNFDVYRFDVKTARLWTGGQEVRLTPKAAAVLKVLVTHSGPVSKDDLFASVWNETVVSDDALTSCIQELRKALGDDPRKPRFIETRHRFGYHFVAPVSGIAADDEVGCTLRAPDASAIAVLPFVNMSPDGDHGYLCEGLAEELINALSHVDGVRVAARTASFQFRGAVADLRAVGRHLRVGTLLEGSVRRFGNRLRVTVQLIDVATGYHRWSQRFDRTLDDVLAVQSEIAQSIARSVRMVQETRLGVGEEAECLPHVIAAQQRDPRRAHHVSASSAEL
jgi:TolB-like protein